MDTRKNGVFKASVMVGLLLAVCMVGAQATTPENNILPLTKPANKAWTTLYYLDADYSGGYTDPLQQIFLDEIASTSQVNVVVLQDTLDEPAFIYYIDENHTKVILEELGEANMADPQVLQAFLTYGKQQYPAERYLLWVYNHGGAWKGACLDETDNAIAMSLDNFQTALSETGGVDIICFLACLMSSIEAVYELRNDVDVFIGSEDLAYFSWFDNVCGDTNQLLTDSPTLSNEVIGSEIVQFFQENNNPPANKLTISALRTENIASLATAIDDLVSYYTKHWLRSYYSIKNAYNNTFLLSNLEGWAPVFEVYDLRGFIENLPQTTKTEAVLDAFDDVLISEAHGTDMGETHGLSIFFQPRKSPYGLFRDYRDESYGLDFAQDTLWNEFLFLFILTNILLKK
ncbi:MAG: clostripain-related cysteine peptidase [Candidatus Thermoplasmatota archaeon]